MYILFTKADFEEKYEAVYCETPGHVKNAIQDAYKAKQDMILTKEVDFRHDIKILEEKAPKTPEPPAEPEAPEDKPEEEKSVRAQKG